MRIVRFLVFKLNRVAQALLRLLSVDGFWPKNFTDCSRIWGYVSSKPPLFFLDDHGGGGFWVDMTCCRRDDGYQLKVIEGFAELSG